MSVNKLGQSYRAGAEESTWLPILSCRYSLNIGTLVMGKGREGTEVIKGGGGGGGAE